MTELEVLSTSATIMILVRYYGSPAAAAPAGGTFARPPSASPRDVILIVTGRQAERPGVTVLVTRQAAPAATDGPAISNLKGCQTASATDPPGRVGGTCESECRLSASGP